MRMKSFSNLKLNQQPTIHIAVSFLENILRIHHCTDNIILHIRTLDKHTYQHNKISLHATTKLLYLIYIVDIIGSPLPHIYLWNRYVTLQCVIALAFEK